MITSRTPEMADLFKHAFTRCDLALQWYECVRTFRLVLNNKRGTILAWTAVILIGSKASGELTNGEVFKMNSFRW